jgi:putative transposase
MLTAIQSFGLSQRRTCRLTGWNRSSLQYQPQPKDDLPVRNRLKELAAQHPRWGCPLLHDVLHAEGLVQNHKRTERLYREEQLSLRRKRCKKLPAILRVPLPPASQPNERWSMDFIHDQLANGRRFRTLTIIDDFTRQCPALWTDHSIGGHGVVIVLEHLAKIRGLPSAITVDNGPEFTGKTLHDWAQKHGVKLNFTTPGKPTQNAFIESFNGKFRNECLNEHWFTTLNEARLLIEAWRQEYNQIRPHSSLGRIPPNRFASLHQNHQPQPIIFSLTPA